MDETDTLQLSLFPMNTVLFPGQVLPLHIFETRYQLMVRRCLADDSPFGVVLIRKGNEVGDDQVEPHGVGTVARIIESTHLPDGTMNIVSVGTDRFRIVKLLHDQPYLRGEVETYPLQSVPASVDLTQQTDRVRTQVAEYIALIAQAAGLQIQVGEMPDSPQQVGYLAAVAMQIDNREKQSLLDSDSLASVLSAESSLLLRENALLAWMVQSKEWPQSVQLGPSGTILPN
jgi:Lon protease-like protein